MKEKLNQPYRLTILRVFSSLNIAQNIEFENTAEWYHDYDGSYEIEDMVLKDGLKIDLGDVKPGYMPNDGYIIFTGIVK